MQVSTHAGLRALGRRGTPLAGVVRAVDRVLGHAESIFVGAGLAFTSLLLFVNVALRYVFLSPIHWAEEATLYLMVWIVFVGGSVIVRTRGHIAVDVLPIFLSARAQQWLRVAVDVVCLAFFATLLYYGAQHTVRVWSTGQVMPAMQAPMWLAYLAVPVGSLLMFVRTMQHLWAQLAAADAAVGPGRDVGD